MSEKYKALAHRAGCIRKQYKLTPYEAACCVLWLAGVSADRLDRLAKQMAEEKAARYTKGVSHEKR
jgi:hypothetical protein